MTFDQYGYLTPYTVIETDLQTFERTFVTAFAASTTRPKIFMAYLDYLDQLRQIVGDGGFYQWLDGSFVTKKLDPKDIDFVTFLDFKVYRKNKLQFETLRKQRLKKDNLTDAYFVKTYPLNHKNRHLFEFDCIEWLFDFGKSQNPKRDKGIIKINF